jgi:hypothetical protein
MVFDICRHVVRDLHEAKDAFQSYFLILATQARSIQLWLERKGRVKTCLDVEMVN